MNKFVLFLMVMALGSCEIIQHQESVSWDSPLWACFSTPGADTVSRIEYTLIEQVENARSTIDISVYEFKNQALADALIRAWERGVQIRMTGDCDNRSDSGYQALQHAGIPLRLGNPGHSMHNKYMIIDQSMVITGSANYTDTAFYHNNENIILIRHPGVAAYYTGDFETMYIRGLFGSDKTGHAWPGFENNIFLITNNNRLSSLEVYFPPYEEVNSARRVDQVLIDRISGLEHSLDFSVFSFTHEDMARSMIHAGARGLQLRGVFDSLWHLNSAYSVHELFIQAQGWYEDVEVRFDGNEDHLDMQPLSGGKCHNKYIMGDYGQEQAFLLTGSYNFSKSSSYLGNDENFIILNDPDILAVFHDDFMRQWRSSYSLTLDQGGDDAAYQDILITEVMWAGSRDEEGTSYPWDDFIELYNPGPHSINISGWQLEGTRATQARSYRLIMSLFPRDTILEPYSILVLALSTNHAWTYPRTLIDPWLFLYEQDSQEAVRLVLKDCDGTLIDEAGSGYGLPLAGGWGDGTQCVSMERKLQPLLPGRMASAWRDAPMTGIYVSPPYQNKTLASPGTLGVDK